MRDALAHSRHDAGATRFRLVLQRNDGAAVAAESCDALQVAVGAGQGHNRTVAVDGVSGGGKVPASALGVPSDLCGGLAQRLGGVK